MPVGHCGSAVLLTDPQDGQKCLDQPDLKLSAELSRSDRFGEDGPSLTLMFYDVVIALADVFLPVRWPLRQGEFTAVKKFGPVDRLL
jgi:hypothetical protein